MRYRSSSDAARRPGVVLLVVMALLALFAAVGLSFVFYPDGEATASSSNSTAFTRTQAEIDPEDLAAFFLNNFLYDTNNPYSAGRGWSMSRSMYGYNDAMLNVTPYNGYPRSVLSEQVAFGATTVDNVNSVNYQKFEGPANPSDPYMNLLRKPEYYGKQKDATFRYVGGANPPWTDYGTNSLFLAQVTADGTVLTPSFWRPWHRRDINGNTLASISPATKYSSLRPDLAWNFVAGATSYNLNVNGVPVTTCFYSPDSDTPLGPDVKNLEFGRGMLQPGGNVASGPYYNNDSFWMDFGFPILTAPNGKRYKALFAPLVMDLSNRLHLLAHGNNLGGTLNSPPGVSGQGYGPPDVSLLPLPGIRVPIVSAVAAPAKFITITTSLPHGFNVNDSIMVSGVDVGGYDGTVTISQVPSPTTFRYPSPGGALLPSGNGFVYNKKALTELQQMYLLRYGPTGPGTLPFSRPGTFGTKIDLDALDPAGSGTPTAGMSSPAPYMSTNNFPILMESTVVGPGVHTVQITQVSSSLPAQLTVPMPWSLTVGMTVNINDPNIIKGVPQAEPVIVTAVNYASKPPTFTAKFQHRHVATKGKPMPITFGPPPSFGFPTYPPSWANGTGELAGNPLAVNMFGPNPTKSPLPLSLQEALLRWGGTNSPALTSDPFKLMPTTFNNSKSRNMVTLASWHLDRVTTSPFLNFDPTAATQYYRLNNGMTSALLGINEVQTITVTATAGQTFTLTFKGATTPALSYNATAQQVQQALQALGSIGPGNVAVGLTSTGPSVYTVTFMGTLGNQNVAKITAASANGATVTTATVTNGQALFTTPSAGPGPNPVTTGTSEFSADWRSRLAERLRVDLTRPLTDYPAPDPKTGMLPNNATLASAIADRQQLARDIFNALVAATGANPNPTVATSADYQATRWLAQLAVNIVDYIDNDDYMTPFNWRGAEYVFGTELPRLVLNEVFAQHDAAGATNVWAELHNPFQQSAANAYPTDQGKAILQYGNVPGGNQPYKIEIYESRPTVQSQLAAPNNSRGDVTDPLMNAPGQTNWGTIALTETVLPSNGAPSAGQPVPKAIAAATAPTPGVTHKGTTVTVTAPGHGFTANQAVTITGVNDAKGNPVVGYWGTFNINAAGLTANSFQYTVSGAVAATLPAAPGAAGGGTALFMPQANNGYYVVGPANARYAAPANVPTFPATYVSPNMSIPSPGAKAIAGTAAKPPGATVAAGNVVTIHTTANHGFQTGDRVIIAGVKDAAGKTLAGYNGTFIITVTAANQFTYVDANAAGLPNGGAGTATLAIDNVTILLRRLANPHMPFNALTNPYITIDYVDTAATGGTIGNLPSGPSVSRAQPYAAAQTGATPHTFFSQNANAAGPFDWLVHLDRPPVNVIELLHVSGYRPHELTQKFVTSNGRYQHRAPWFDPNAMIFRALDQFSTHYMNGTFTGSRFPGNINLNTITEREVFLGLCDPHDAIQQYPNAWFTQTDVNRVFDNINNLRKTPGGGPPASETTPFKSFSAAKSLPPAPAAPTRVSFEDTWFRPDSNGNWAFGVGTGTHPYVQASLFQKIYNNITTTSNVFAVWWTVGYFEIVDESVRPARLGAEIGRDQNRHIRHRFFAIVDRSGLELNRKVSTTAVTQAMIDNFAAQGQPVPVTLADPPNLMQPWVINNGMLLEVLPPPGVAEQPETIVVGGGKNVLPTFTTGVAGCATIAADFKFPHRAGSIFILRGNPGPKDTSNMVSTTGTGKVNAGANSTMQLNAISGANWSVQPGMFLQVTSPTGTEVVFVKTVNVGTKSFTADFTLTHRQQAPLQLWPPHVTTWVPNFNPRQDSNVVLHLSVIK